MITDDNKIFDATRPGEREVALPDRCDARIVFIGRIRTPFATRRECPRRGRLDGPLCRIEVDPLWQEGLKGIAAYGHVEVLYWMDQARRDLVVQSPRTHGEAVGTFALRSPVRPNPVATSIVALERVDNGVLLVRGLDCIDGTPLVDLKPARDAFVPLAPEKPGADG